jgi:hypothetical protein
MWRIAGGILLAVFILILLSFIGLVVLSSQPL